MDLIEGLRTTGAVREFRPDPVPDDVVYRLLDTARFAPNGGNRQAWHVVVVRDPAVKRGIAYLSRTQGNDGFWNEPRYTATGFPRVFYLRYHGYAKFFPLWALARYRNLSNANAHAVAFGM